MRTLISRGKSLSQTFICLLAILTFSCQGSEDVQPDNLNVDLQSDMKSKTKLHYGPSSMVGDGTARVWVETMQGKPTSIGIEVTEDALNDLLTSPMFYYSLKLPGQAHATGFKTITLEWNPMGHDPEGVYTLPHFDFHFFMQTEGQISKIMGGPDPGAYELEGTVFPAFYSFGPAPFAVPHMGVHWSDVRSPEFSMDGFSRTFIYGSYGDRVTFLEPMITLAYLQSLEVGETEVLPVPSLLMYEDPGYYPTTYTISHNTNGTYTIALTDLVWRNKNR